MVYGRTDNTCKAKDTRFQRGKIEGILDMAELKDIVAYILKKYPTKSDMSNARLTKLVYLSDWKHSIKTYSQISNIRLSASTLQIIVFFAVPPQQSYDPNEIIIQIRYR